jgi:hypothetical protein
MEDARYTAQEAAGQAQEKAQQAAGQAMQQARRQVDQGSTQAGERLSTTASDMRSVAQQLREQGKDQPAKMADQAADRAERLGGYLKEADADRILADLEDFGRRQPLAVMFGGLAIGFAASRFLKASSQQRYEQGGGRFQSATTDSRAALPPARFPDATSVQTAPSAEPGYVDPAISPTGGIRR